MACVRDQNGNHVVQKAIERIPAEHIQFIVNAFQGEVCKNATHPYGCRVIQRMLEHCEEPTRLAILQELHSCASTLISDQYGNYVTQHLIQHGRPEDRRKIINLVISNLVKFSKHKFASNVVEKSIEFGALEERLQIVQKLTMTNERGESPVQTLIRDQYGNYVVRKYYDSGFETLLSRSQRSSSLVCKARSGRISWNRSSFKLPYLKDSHMANKLLLLSGFYSEDNYPLISKMMVLSHPRSSLLLLHLL